MIKPGINEINCHLKNYDGIIIASKKYRNKPNPIIAKDLSKFGQLLMAGQVRRQMDLFQKAINFLRRNRQGFYENFICISFLTSNLVMTLVKGPTLHPPDLFH